MVLLMPVEYPHVLLAVTILASLNFCFSLPTAGARSRVLNKEFMSQNFQSVHDEALKEDNKSAKRLPAKMGGGGFPDDGNGWHMAK